jgi:hypothetical protein
MSEHEVETGVCGAHLVGSIPLRDAEEVFRTVAERLGGHVRRIPDGETGERSNWIEWQIERFAAHPDFVQQQVDETAYRPMPHFAVRDGADPAGIAFGALGYADAALASWAVFERLQAAGELPAGARFQVSLPTPLAPVGLYVDPPFQAAVEPAYEAAMVRELEQIGAAIPHDRLAIQWDTAVEFGMLEGVFPTWLDDVEAGVVERLVRLGRAVPADVPVGYHLCYGDAGHRHFVEPQDTAKLVAISNGVIAGLDRAPAWIHLPVPRDRDDAAYFAPLRELRLPAETELHLGLVHAGDGDEGARRRIAAARTAVERFGVATECGFGRRDPATVPALLDQHAAVAAPLG